MKFTTFVKKQKRVSIAACGNSNNYTHTHDRVHFNNETRVLTLEEVCVNQYGSCYGRNIGFKTIVPIGVVVPPSLLGEGLKWDDFEFLPANYGSPIIGEPITKHKIVARRRGGQKR